MTKTSKIKSQVKSGVSKISSRKRDGALGKVSSKEYKAPAKMITLRGIDPALSKKIKSEAGKANKSINQFLVDTLKQGLGMGKKQKFTTVFHDLDELFGKWSDKEFYQVQGQIEAQRAIDPELWQ